MITPQLIDFIKQSLQQGVTKEKITADLVSNGWALIDIEQGFNSLITPPIVNPSPISTTINEPTVTITEENHSNKTPIILTVVTLLVLALGASGYYFRNDLPIVKDLIKSDTSTVGELSQDQTDQVIPKQPQQPETPVVTETTPIQDSSIKTEETPTPTTTPIVASNVVATTTGLIDCGKDSLLSVGEYYNAHRENIVAKCLGESVLNNCKNAKAIFDGSYSNLDSSMDFQIINKNNTCLFKITDNETKEYNQCPISVAKEIIENPKGSNIFISKELDVSNPEKYGADLINYGGIGFILEESNNQKLSEKEGREILIEKSKKYGCSGNLPISILQRLNKTQVEAILIQVEKQVKSALANATLYFDKSESYKDACKTEITDSINGLKNISTYKCFDSKESFVFSASLSNGNFYCADYTGFTGEIKKQITGASCQ